MNIGKKNILQQIAHSLVWTAHGTGQTFTNFVKSFSHSSFLYLSTLDKQMWFVADVVIACLILGMLGAIGYLIYYCIKIAYPRGWLPFRFNKTESYTHEWVTQVNSLLQTIETVFPNNDSAITMQWLKDVPVQDMVANFRAIMSNDLVQFQKNVGTYARIKAQILAAPQTEDTTCADGCAWQSNQALIALNGLSADEQDTFKTFITDFDAVLAKVMSCTAPSTFTDYVFDIWKDMPNPGSNRFATEAQLYVSNDAKTVSNLNALQDAALALQALIVQCDPIFTEMVDFYSANRFDMEEDYNRTDFVTMLKEGPKKVFFDNYGYAIQNYWFGQIVPMFDPTNISQQQQDFFNKYLGMDNANAFMTGQISASYDQVKSQLGL